MRRAVLAFALLLGVLPLHAGDFAVGIRHLGHAPSEAAFEGGELEVVTSRGFAATVEWFLSPRFSTQFAATFVNPAAFLHPRDGETIDLNTFGMDTYSASARRHFDRGRRLVPFVGAGLAYTSFGNLEERFGDRIEMRFDDDFTGLVEGGARYHVTQGLWIDATLTYMPLGASPSFVKNTTTFALPSEVKVDPAVLSVGASWRF